MNPPVSDKLLGFIIFCMMMGAGLCITSPGDQPEAMRVLLGFVAYINLSLSGYLGMMLIIRHLRRRKLIAMDDREE